jgi:hypothetical protein
MLQIILIVSALLGMVSVLVRAIESIYQLRQKSELSTAQKCWQVLVNFFKVEKYA